MTAPLHGALELTEMLWASALPSYDILYLLHLVVLQEAERGTSRTEQQNSL